MTADVAIFFCKMVDVCYHDQMYDERLFEWDEKNLETLERSGLTKEFAVEIISKGVSIEGATGCLCYEYTSQECHYRLLFRLVSVNKKCKLYLMSGGQVQNRISSKEAH
jgi:hypothetical protein